MLSAYCLLPFAFTHPYELFIYCLPLSYTTERRSICMRKIINQKRLRTWEATAGVSCFVAGLLAPLLGSLLTVIEWIVGVTLHPWIHVAGTALFIVAIPLILFAGFCLDWAERAQKESSHNPQHTQRGAASLAQIAVIANIFGIALLCPAALHAQQTIFNVPTTDVLDRGKFYAEFDVSLKPTDSVLMSKFSSFVPPRDGLKTWPKSY